ncbi:Hint domain-containing protein [Asaia krungthepensis]|nr:Hint domain-containing protein [Asaia krungthepensis]
MSEVVMPGACAVDTGRGNLERDASGLSQGGDTSENANIIPSISTAAEARGEQSILLTKSNDEDWAGSQNTQSAPAETGGIAGAASIPSGSTALPESMGAVRVSADSPTASTEDPNSPWMSSLVDCAISGTYLTLYDSYISNVSIQQGLMSVHGGEIHDSFSFGSARISLEEGAYGNGLTAKSGGDIALSGGSTAENLTIEPGGLVYVETGCTISKVECASGGHVGIAAGTMVSALTIMAGARFYTDAELGHPVARFDRDLTDELADAPTGQWTASRDDDGLTYFTSGFVTTREISSFNGIGWTRLIVSNGATVSGIVARGLDVFVKSGGTLISSYIQKYPENNFYGGGVYLDDGAVSVGNIYMAADVEVRSGASSTDDSFCGNVPGTVSVMTGAVCIRPNIGRGTDFNVMSGATLTDPSQQANARMRIEVLAETLYIDKIEACFLAGTLMLTDDGEVRVETLAGGDRLVCIEHGERVVREVVRVIRRTAHVRLGLPDDLAGYPVRIRSNAFDENLPSRDLLVTSEHCFLFEGRFVPVRMLVNGTSVAYDRSFRTYDYHHVELANHAIIFANGVETESYLDTSERSSRLRNGRISGEVHAARSWTTDAAAPLDTARGFVEPLFQALAQRASALGLGSCENSGGVTSDPALVLYDHAGRRCPILSQSPEGATFSIPAGIPHVWLCSRTVRACDGIGAFVDDRRALGVLIGQMRCSGTQGEMLTNPHLSQPLIEGWDALEAGHCRWTKGQAFISLAGFSSAGDMTLSIEILGGGPYRLDETKVPDLAA